MGLKPVLGTGDDLVELFCLRRALQLGLTLTLCHPQDGVIRVRIDGFVVQALLPTKSQGMDDGQELPDIIGAMHWPVMEHAIACLQVYCLILHRSRIARTSSIHRPRICPYLRRQGQYRVIAVYRGIDLFHLHTFWDFDAKQAHATLDDLCHVLGKHEADGLLLFVGLVEDRVVMVELVEHLCEFVAVVGNA